MNHPQFPAPCKTWPGPRGKILPFVLLKHTVADSSHYDLMLETALKESSPNTGSLWSMRCALAPAPGKKKYSWHSHGKHRRRYLSFEGDIGNDRGFVKRIDEGFYIVRAERSRMLLEISGKLLRGTFELQRRGYGEYLWRRVSGSDSLTALPIK